MRLYNEAECRETSKYSRAQRWRLERRGEFPRRIRLGVRRIAWVADEVDAWIEQRIADRDAGESK